MLLNTDRARNVLCSENIDVLIATSKENVAYAADYRCLSHSITPGVQVFCLIPQDPSEGLELIAPSLEIDAWAEQPGTVERFTPYGTLFRTASTSGDIPHEDRVILDTAARAEGVTDALAALVRSLQARGMERSTIAIDESNLGMDAWRHLESELPDANVVPGAKYFRFIRSVKTEPEIQRLAMSAQVTETAIQHALGFAVPGATERDIAKQFMSHVSLHGGDPGFWVVCAGRRTAHTHPRLSDYQIQDGDLVKFDVGCRYDFYWSDIGRTKAIGVPREHEASIYEALCLGLQAAIQAVRPGVTASTIFEAAVETVRSNGVDEYERHHCGHGIGISVYDSPLIQAKGHPGIYGIDELDPVLEEGMVINLETPFYIVGERGFIVEDTIVVRSSGAELLSTRDHSIEIAA